MAGEGTITTLAGFHKEVYGNDANIDKVLPASAVLQDIISFDEDNKIGDSFHQGVFLTHEHGFTANGSGGTVVTLENANPAYSQDATLTSCEMIGRARMSYTAASRAAAGGKQAYKKAFSQMLLNLRKAAVKRLELELLYGKDGLGVVESRSGEDVVITAGSWCPTAMAGMKNATFEWWTTTGTGATEKGLTTGSTLAGINYATRTLTFSSGGPSGGSAVSAGDVLYFYGYRLASSYNECDGLMRIAGNSGTLFGIDGSSSGYDLWAGNTKSSFGVPTMGRFLDAVTSAVDKGLDEKVFMLVSPRTWEVLNSDLAGQRMFDGSYSKAQADNGTQAIRYYGQAGEIELRSHPYLRRGDAVVVPRSAFSRVGSAELGMGVPGTQDREVYFHLENANAVEIRTYTDQALFCIAPSHCVYITGITYAS